MSFPRYESYKDSGVEWLGEVPAHWEIIPVKNIAKIVNGYPFDSKLFNSTEGHPLIRIRDLNSSDSETYYKGDFVETAAITSDDVLIGMDGDFNVGRWRGNGIGLLNQRMCCVRGKSKLITSLLEYALPFPLKAINEVTYSTTVKHLSSFQVEKTFVAIPKHEAEQQSIATFLDNETTKIDALIAEQRRLIELLKEKRQAVISHAVTKGLPLPSPGGRGVGGEGVPMKDSGIEWLGKVPAHWSISALNYRYDVALGKMLDEKRITGEHLAPYLRNIDVQWDKINTIDLPEMDFKGVHLDRYSLQKGDLLVCEGGEVGRAAIWDAELMECYYQKALHRLRPKSTNSDHPRMMLYQLWNAASSGRFIGSEGKATIAHLTAEALRRYKFAFPPYDEQVAIIVFLDQETTKLDSLTTEAQRAIDLLKERRSALISAAVTGKIDVRNQVSTTESAA